VTWAVGTRAGSHTPDARPTNKRRRQQQALLGVALQRRGLEQLRVDIPRRVAPHVTIGSRQPQGRVPPQAAQLGGRVLLPLYLLQPGEDGH
jgi:hypothetical protein